MERKAKFAGFWYPSDIKDLDAIINLESNKDGAGLRYAVLPHAGLYYSGSLINEFFSRLDKDVDHVLILSPSHYHYLRPGIFTTSAFTSSSTPYGSIETKPFDLKPNEIDDRAVNDEHAVEMFLPFIKKHGGLSVSYALISHVRDYGEIDFLAAKLFEYLDDRTAVVASSDFTHYGKRFSYEPYGPCAVGKVVKRDLICAELLATGRSEEAFSRYHESTICGLVPALILSRFASLKKAVGIVGPHCTSLDKGGKEDDFVSYCDVFWRK